MTATSPRPDMTAAFSATQPAMPVRVDEQPQVPPCPHQQNALAALARAARSVV